ERACSDSSGRELCKVLWNVRRC
ncbi:unnamed protein product, partial [Oikopleura dioica]